MQLPLARGTLRQAAGVWPAVTMNIARAHGHGHRVLLSSTPASKRTISNAGLFCLWDMSVSLQSIGRRLREHAQSGLPKRLVLPPAAGYRIM